MSDPVRDGSARGRSDPPTRRVGRRARRAWNHATTGVRRRLRPAESTAPCFLVGCGRSGTNMVSWQLDRSWRVELVNENDERAFDDWRLRSLDAVDDVVDGSRAAVVLFKPILDTPALPNLLERHPGATAVFMTRAVDDVVNSAVRMFGADNWARRVRGWVTSDFREFARWPPPEATKVAITDLWHDDLDAASATALYWLFYNRLYGDLGLDTSARVRLLRYEDVVRRPHQRLAEVFDHIGVEAPGSIESGVVSSSIGRDSAPALDPDVRQACDAFGF